MISREKDNRLKDYLDKVNQTPSWRLSLYSKSKTTNVSLEKQVLLDFMDYLGQN